MVSYRLERWSYIPVDIFQFLYFMLAFNLAQCGNPESFHGILLITMFLG